MASSCGSQAAAGASAGKGDVPHSKVTGLVMGLLSSVPAI